MTRPVTRGSKEFLNEMLARFSGTLANVSSFKARPLRHKNRVPTLLCYCLSHRRFKYYSSWPNTIPHSATTYVGRGDRQTIFIEYNFGEKDAHKHMLKPSGSGEDTADSSAFSL